MPAGCRPGPARAGPTSSASSPSARARSPTRASPRQGLVPTLRGDARARGPELHRRLAGGPPRRRLHDRDERVHQGRLHGRLRLARHRQLLRGEPDRHDRPRPRRLSPRHLRCGLDGRPGRGQGARADPDQQPRQRGRPRRHRAHDDRRVERRRVLDEHDLARVHGHDLGHARHRHLADRRLRAGHGERILDHLDLHLADRRPRRRRLPRQCPSLRRGGALGPLARAHHHAQPLPARQGAGPRRRAQRLHRRHRVAGQSRARHRGLPRVPPLRLRHRLAHQRRVPAHVVGHERADQDGVLRPLSPERPARSSTPSRRWTRTPAARRARERPPTPSRSRRPIRRRTRRPASSPRFPAAAAQP